MGTRLSLGLVVMALVLAPAAWADETTPAERRATAAIEWKLPHQFDEALAEAKKTNRLLLIKGVSFGIDDAGAKCATKGKW